MPQTIACKTCGNAFTTYRLTNNVPLYCSRKCADEGHKKEVKPRTCLHCKCQFAPPWESIKTKFCSRSCHDAYRTAKKLIATCKICGSSFKARSGKPNLYCSYACKKTATNEKVAIKCDQCGNDFYVIKSRRKDARFCSERCRNQRRKLDGNGYAVIHHAGKVRKVHRVIMESYLGRELQSHENVHHKNGDRSDNRLVNLELWSTMQPCGQRVEDKLAYARDIIALYDGYIAP